MQQNFYLTVFPMEALIASQLEPEAFGSYMAVGARKGSAEALIFIKLKEPIGPFDWEDARKQCVPHEDGQPKHSYYLSIYRVLENLLPEALGSIYLVTRDGRSLELPGVDWASCRERIPANWNGVGLYKELCPVLPLVVTSLKPAEFGAYMTSPDTHTRVPALLFADLRVIENLEDLHSSGNIGNVYDRQPEHLRSCIQQIREQPGKYAKIVDRTYTTRFSYNLIDSGFFLCRPESTLFWPMPDVQKIKENNYDWGRSADLY